MYYVFSQQEFLVMKQEFGVIITIRFCHLIFKILGYKYYPSVYISKYKPSSNLSYLEIVVTTVIRMMC